ncbi:MAG TPA: patatin-like phospholipase family protein [Nevskia sp.]|nr:patatin-like phospholipase family protein [Nevskia sp.]
MDFLPILAQCRLFAGLAPSALARLEALCTVQELRGGETLFRVGRPAEYLYIVALGRLRAVLPDGSVAGDITRLEPVGEIGLLSGEPHGADVHALRDSLLLRIARDDLLAFVVTYPAALLEMTRVIVHRLRRNQRRAFLETARQAQSIALLPGHPGIDISGVTRRLQQALESCGVPVQRLDAARLEDAMGAGASERLLSDPHAHQQLMNWLDEHERSNANLLYCAGDGDSAWAECCLRQCDRVLIVADSTQAPRDAPVLDTLRRLELRVPVNLLLLRPDQAPPGDVAAWRAHAGAGAHYFVRPDAARDYASLARQLTGRGLGLVLSGGGARGFAHIGLMRALEELNIPVDLAGGTSMGAFFSALLACGYSSREMTDLARETFVARNFLNDYVLPRVSLIRGRKFLGRLHDIFGERRVEDLRTPYFCVSTNLTQARTMVHDSGLLATWVGTSMAIPGVAPPVAYKGELLVDGAVTNSLPTDVMQALGRGPIVASDVSTEGGLKAPGIEGPDPEALLRRDGNKAQVSLIDILFGGMALTSESGVKLRASRADLYLRMPVAGIALFAWKRLDEIAERGYEHAMQKLQAFKAEHL